MSALITIGTQKLTLISADVRCNKVEDMMGIDLQAIKMIADQGSEYQITGQHITFEGVCPECAKKESH